MKEKGAGQPIHAWFSLSSGQREKAMLACADDVECEGETIFDANEEANDEYLITLELLVALQRATGGGRLGPPLCTEMAMIESLPYTMQRDAQELDRY